MENPYFLARLCQAVLESENFHSESSCAQQFARLAWESFVVCEGRMGDRSIELEQWLPKDMPSDIAI